MRTAIDELVDELCGLAGADHSRVHDLVVVGNPIMHHLVLGLDPTPLGAAPFTLTTAAAVRGRAADIGIGLPNATLYIGPCIAGHVGADAAAATLAEGPHRTAEPMLVVDVGTNAEIVLGDGHRVLAASSPTGPAFEGAQISCGQRATPGAVERIRIDPKTWEPRFKVIGCELWSDDPGFADELDRAGLQVSGLCGSGIIEVIAEMFLAGIADRHGVISSEVGRSPRIVADGRTFSYVLQTEPILLSITQNDVRAVQLAKAALRAGIDLLREHAGIDEVLDIRLAGAFGAHIDPVRAMVLGLVPDTPAGGVRAAGNASGVGAVRMLLSGEQRLGDRAGGAVGDQDRDGHRVPLPGAVRRGHGLPPRDRSHAPSGRGDRSSRGGRGRSRPGFPPAPQTPPRGLTIARQPPTSRSGDS